MPHKTELPKNQQKKGNGPANVKKEENKKIHDLKSYSLLT